MFIFLRYIKHVQYFITPHESRFMYWLAINRINIANTTNTTDTKYNPTMNNLLQETVNIENDKAI